MEKPNASFTITVCPAIVVNSMGNYENYATTLSVTLIMRFCSQMECVHFYKALNELIYTVSHTLVRSKYVEMCQK